VYRVSLINAMALHSGFGDDVGHNHQFFGCVHFYFGLVRHSGSVSTGIGDKKRIFMSDLNRILFLSPVLVDTEAGRILNRNDVIYSKRWDALIFSGPTLTLGMAQFSTAINPLVI